MGAENPATRRADKHNRLLRQDVAGRSDARAHGAARQLTGLAEAIRRSPRDLLDWVQVRRIFGQEEELGAEPLNQCFLPPDFMLSQESL